MMKRQAVALILGFTAVLVISLSQVVRAGKPGSEQPHADGVFDNSPGYRITGDYLAPGSDFPFPHTIYAHGVDGVANTIWMSNSGDYVQNMNRTSRTINFDFSAPACGSSPLPPCGPNGPTSIPPCPSGNAQPLYSQGQLLNVQDVGLVGFMSNPLVESLGAAQFATDLGWISFGNVPNVGTPSTDGSSSIKVELIGNRTWVVSTYECPNDIAVLTQQVKGKMVKSWYHMPFRMIIRERP